MNKIWHVLPLLALLTAPTSGMGASSLRLSLPVLCVMGEICTIQNYFDRDPGPGYQDYECGSLSYNGHTGTDIRVHTLKAMRSGIAVVAAAPGRVKGIRDGMEDEHPNKLGVKSLKGREAGNGVVIDHGNGWETQYSHLRQDSVAVFPGQQVKRGDLLGLIGHSGMAEFPHVEFLVRHNGQPLDPFTGKTTVTGCGAPRQPLWNPEALKQLSYHATGSLAAGFALEPPTQEKVADPPPLPTSLLPQAPMLIFWVNLYGVREGDREMIRLLDPNGKVLAVREEAIPKHRAQHLRFVGKKQTGTWPSGLYTGEYTLTRMGGIDPLLVVQQSIKVPDW